MKLKKILAGALAAVVAVGSMSVSAFAEEETLVSGDFEYEVLDDGTVSITKYLGEEEAVEIPAEIDGKAVTVIGPSAFYSCLSLIEIAIPDSVITIGDYAFSNCRYLI